MNHTLCTYLYTSGIFGNKMRTENNEIIHMGVPSRHRTALRAARIVLELFYKLRCPPARTLSSVTYDAHAPE